MPAGSVAYRVVLPLLLASLALMGCGPAPGLVRRMAERHPEARFYFKTADSLVALTLDDGPHATLTPEVLDVLAAHGARATFFLMGRKIPGNEEIVRRIVAEGHELGNHLMTATPSIRLSREAFSRQLRQAHDRLAAFDTVRWLRPASGRFSREMAVEAEQYGYRIALGSVYPNDARNPFRGYQVRFILKHVRPGGVIVLHEGMGHRRGVLGVLRRILPELHRRGYQVVTLGDLERQVRAREEP